MDDNSTFYWNGSMCNEDDCNPCAPYEALNWTNCTLEVPLNFSYCCCNVSFPEEFPTVDDLTAPVTGFFIRFPSPCPDNSTCWDSDGSFQCICDDGYRDEIGDGANCTQIDECKEPATDKSKTKFMGQLCTKCDFVSDRQWYHPFFKTFADCYYACLTYKSLDCQALEFIPANPDKTDIEFADYGECWINARDDDTVKIVEHESKYVWVVAWGTEEFRAEYQELPPNKRVETVYLKYSNDCSDNADCSDKNGSYTCT
jgi:hypothetical protein